MDEKMNKSKTAKRILMGFIFGLAGVAALAWAKSDTVFYEDKSMGISLTGPKGWYLTRGETFQDMISKTIDSLSSSQKGSVSNKMKILVVFTKFPFNQKAQTNPSISLVAEAVNTEVFNLAKSKSKIDYANNYIATVQSMLQNFTLIKKPRLMKINGNECVSFEYEAMSDTGKVMITMQYLVYIFFKQNISYNIACVDIPGSFDKNKKEFESCVKTFQLK